MALGFSVRLDGFGFVGFRVVSFPAEAADAERMETGREDMMLDCVRVCWNESAGTAGRRGGAGDGAVELDSKSAELMYARL